MMSTTKDKRETIMHPEFCQLGPFQVYWYGIFMAMGALAALLNWAWLGRGSHRTFNYCSDMLFWIMVSGVVGARIAYIAANLPDFAAAPATIFRIDQGGLIFYGGFIGSGLALALFAKRRDENLWGLFDFVITGVPLAHAFGRIGCIMNGCCYGGLHEGALALHFPKDSLVWWRQVQEGLITRFTPQSLGVHPVQAYEALCGLLIFALLQGVYRQKRARGTVVGLYLVTYAVARFSLEYLRGDPRVRFETPFSVAQYVSIGLFITGTAILVTRRRKTTET